MILVNEYFKIKANGISVFESAFGCCQLRNLGASLQALKSEVTHITSCRNVISIKHKTGAIFVGCWL